MRRFARVAKDSRLRRVLALAWALALVSSWTSGAQAQAVGSKLWITNGTVSAMVQDGSTLYVGGSFSQVGPPTGSGVPIDGSTGLPAASFPMVNGPVYTVAADGSGGYFIGGSFTAVGGVARQNLAQVNSSKQVTAWNPGPNGEVRALVLDSGVLYVGGLFTNIGGQAR